MQVYVYTCVVGCVVGNLKVLAVEVEGRALRGLVPAAATGSEGGGGRDEGWGGSNLQVSSSATLRGRGPQNMTSQVLMLCLHRVRGGRGSCSCSGGALCNHVVEYFVPVGAPEHSRRFQPADGIRSAHAAASFGAFSVARGLQVVLAAQAWRTAARA